VELVEPWSWWSRGASGAVEPWSWWSRGAGGAVELVEPWSRGASGAVEPWSYRPIYTRARDSQGRSMWGLYERPQKKSLSLMRA
jgi:hypothetical protein